MILFILILILIGYIFGSIPNGYLVAKSKGIDIFSVGSKNPGSTNVGRVLGKKYGVIVFAFDLLKTIISIVIVRLLLKYGFFDKMLGITLTARIMYVQISTFYVGFGAVLGHNFPFTTKFKGGKGIACTGAVVICFNFIYGIILYLFHKIIVKITKYVSLASILTMVALFLSALIMIYFNIYPFNFEKKYDVLLPIFLISFTGIVRHKSNIIRLLNGTENKEQSK